MKTVEHQKIQIDDFEKWFRHLHNQHSEILGAEWDDEKKLLKVFYEDTATELTKEELKNIQIPTILRFRKTLPKIDIPNATPINENTFQVETFDVETTRKTVKEKYSGFEEVKE
jgi:hypothetical protein